MELDADSCYRATASRDARFDGRFFIGVKTTGVYCRPVCPARTPLRKNVDFYRCATEAESAGFRPCLRCRPETSPGTPAWLGTSTTVSRGLRLIGEGALDEGSVEDLASKLGIGPRHLRRLFEEHLGATAVAVAQTRRLHFAKKLMDETDLSLTDVAFAAGFGSLRRFNAVFRGAYGAPPSAIRRRNSAAKNVEGGTLRLKLHYRPPMAWDALMAFYSGRAIPGVEQVVGGRYRRVVWVDGQMGVIEAWHDAGRRCVVLAMPASLSRHAAVIAEGARRMFDLRADPEAVSSHLIGDGILKKEIRRVPGLRVPGCWDPFELGVRAILGQQISVAAATTLSGRIVTSYGEKLESETALGLTHRFPTPARLAGARFNGIGLTGKRIETVRGFSRAVRDGAVKLDASTGLEEAVAELTTLPGIGPWTAQYIAMRALGEPDGFPSGDLGLRKAVSNGEGLVSEKALLARAERWRPWRAYGAMYLWASCASGG